ncbi:MAG: hypothetical protein HOQ10_12830, partial [Frateuria sp.]|nr:hypothetical protein [Frateuria sp.]
MRIERGACSPEEAERALAALDGGEGLYFGVDAGIAGLHPLQGTLVTRPALRLGVHEDRLEVRALTAFGQALLDSPLLREWGGSGPVERLRGFLRCFEASPDVLLLGALRFEAHRLAPPPVIPAKAGIQRNAQATPKAEALDSRLRGNDDGQELGVFYFPERMLRRDPSGQWSWVQFSLPGIDVGTEPLATATSSEPPAVGDDYAPGGYAERVGRALTVLRDRPLVSLTLSQSYRRRVEMPPSQAFARLRAANPAPATFFLNDGSGLRLFGASPDLQLVVSNGEVQALPVCGTVARRPGAQ